MWLKSKPPLWDLAGLAAWLWGREFSGELHGESLALFLLALMIGLDSDWNLLRQRHFHISINLEGLMQKKVMQIVIPVTSRLKLVHLGRIIFRALILVTKITIEHHGWKEFCGQSMMASYNIGVPYCTYHLVWWAIDCSIQCPQNNRAVIYNEIQSSKEG